MKCKRLRMVGCFTRKSKGLQVQESPSSSVLLFRCWAISRRASQPRTTRATLIFPLSTIRLCKIKLTRVRSVANQITGYLHAMRYEKSRALERIEPGSEDCKFDDSLSIRRVLVVMAGIDGRMHTKSVNFVVSLKFHTGARIKATSIKLKATSQT